MTNLFCDRAFAVRNFLGNNNFHLDFLLMFELFSFVLVFHLLSNVSWNCRISFGYLFRETYLYALHSHFTFLKVNIFYFNKKSYLLLWRTGRFFGLICQSQAYSGFSQLRDELAWRLDGMLNPCAEPAKEKGDT